MFLFERGSAAVWEWFEVEGFLRADVCLVFVEVENGEFETGGVGVWEGRLGVEWKRVVLLNCSAAFVAGEPM